MPVIQFSIDTEYYLLLLERGKRLGLSEHQVAKYQTILGCDSATDEDILDLVRSKAQYKANRKTRAQPIRG